MNQMKTGKFIADMRKAQGLTQKELAEKLGMSDKTVSKWECSNGMPDNAVMLELCDILQINVNELLSGERLSTEDYSRKAEENIMNLIQETDVKERTNQRSFITSLVGEIALIMAVGCIVILSGGTYGQVISYFLDMPSLIIIIGILLLVLLASGMWKDFLHAFTYLYHKDSAPTKAQLTRAFHAVKLAIATNMISGILGVVVPFIIVLHRLDDPAQLGPNISIMCICVFYAALIDLLLLPIAFRLKAKIEE